MILVRKVPVSGGGVLVHLSKCASISNVDIAATAASQNADNVDALIEFVKRTALTTKASVAKE